MTTLYLATGHGPIIINRNGDLWRAESPLEQRSARCVAVDPHRPRRVFCSTRNGVWRSEDAGGTWHQVFEEIPHERVTALAVSAAERVGGHGVVYVGTEPSAVFRSEDGGEPWSRSARSDREDALAHYQREQDHGGQRPPREDAVL